MHFVLKIPVTYLIQETSYSQFWPEDRKQNKSKFLLRHLNCCHTKNSILFLLPKRRLQEFLNLSPTAADTLSGVLGCKVYTNFKSTAANKISHLFGVRGLPVLTLFPSHKQLRHAIRLVEKLEGKVLERKMKEQRP